MLVQYSLKEYHTLVRQVLPLTYNAGEKKKRNKVHTEFISKCLTNVTVKITLKKTTNSEFMGNACQVLLIIIYSERK